VIINEDITHKKLISLTSVTTFKKMEIIYSRCKNGSTKLEEQNPHLRLPGNRNKKLGNTLREEVR
jgi:hypothetical protein